MYASRLVGSAFSLAGRAAHLVVPSPVFVSVNAIKIYFDRASTSLSSLLEAAAAAFGIDGAFVTRHKMLFAVCLIVLCAMLVVTTWGLLTIVAVGVGIGGVAWLMVAV